MEVVIKINSKAYRQEGNSPCYWNADGIAKSNAGVLKINKLTTP